MTSSPQQQSSGREELRKDIERIVVQNIGKLKNRIESSEKTPTYADSANQIIYEALALIDQYTNTRVAEAEKAKNQAYWERNQLVAALSKIYPAWLGYHEGEEWEDDWRTIVYIKIPVRVKVVSGDQHNQIPKEYWFETRWQQLSWHIHDSEKHLFEHLDPGLEEWDGHTTEEKYVRLAQLTKAKEEQGEA